MEIVRMPYIKYKYTKITNEERSLSPWYGKIYYRLRVYLSDSLWRAGELSESIISPVSSLTFVEETRCGTESYVRGIVRLRVVSL